MWNDDLFSNPSRGFNTTLQLSYNSLSTIDTTTGFGWSIQASAPIRLGSALQFHPKSNPTSMVMVDGTGASHQWNWNAATSTWTSPPGVHLFLQGVACQPQDSNARAWKMTSPDRTTIYYDCEGYPTAQIDANGNEADFTYTAKQSENKPEEFLQYITDPVGRQTLTLTYYLKGDATYSYIDATGALVSGTNLTNPAIIDHVKSIVDISGRTVNFFYTSQGLLGRVVDGAGDSAAKTFNFSYDATQGMKNVKLVAVQDPRGHTTQVAYEPTSSPFKWLAQSITDRLGHATSFAYVQPGAITGAVTQTTVTDANDGATVYQTDASGRMLQVTDPLGQTTKQSWDSDNNVASLTEDNGAQSQFTYDPNTGYPLTTKDALAVKNNTAATVYTYATTDAADASLNGHIADLTDVTTPQGRRTHYTYYDNGNVHTKQDPNGTAANAPAPFITTYIYDAYGELTSVEDANQYSGDHKTTTYCYLQVTTVPCTAAPQGAPTGEPSLITDPLGHTTSFTYGARGEVKSSTDPLLHTTTATYDVFLRPTGGQAPKDQAHNIITPAPIYDGNDNVTSSSPPYIGSPMDNSATTTIFNDNDQPTTVTLPDNTGSASPAPRVVTYGYDNVGNQTTVTDPLGNGTVGPYTTTTTYDADNQVKTVTRPNPDDPNHPQVVTYGYDTVGNRTTVTDPLGHVTTTGYDWDHRKTGTIDAQGNTTGIGYDLDGLVTSTTDQNGITVILTLDPNGQVTQVKSQHSHDASGPLYEYTLYTYDQVGNQTSVISPRGVDAGAAIANCATNKTNGTANPCPFTTFTTYDADNRKSSSLGAYDPNDTFYKQSQEPEVDYTYDDAGQLIQVDQFTKAHSGPNVPTAGDDHAFTEYSYFDNGWAKESVDPFGLATSYDYNGRGQQTSQKVFSVDAPVSAQRSMASDYYPDGSLDTYTDSGMPANWQDQVLTADSSSGSSQAASWTPGTLGQGYRGATYYTSTSTSYDDFTWTLNIPQNGNYRVYAYFSTTSAAASYTITSYNGQNTTKTIDQPQKDAWIELTDPTGLFFAQGDTHSTGQTITLAHGGGGVVADAIRLVRVPDPNDPPPPSGAEEFHL